MGQGQALERMPTLVGKAVGIARRELLAADPDLTIATDGSDDAIVRTQIPRADQMVHARRQVRLSPKEPRSVEAPRLDGRRVGQAYMLTGEAGLDLLIIDEAEPSAPSRRPTARDADVTIARHHESTPPGALLAAGSEVVVVTRRRRAEDRESVAIPAHCPDQTSDTADALPDFADSSEYGNVGKAMTWCGDHGLALKLYDAVDTPFGEGRDPTGSDLDREIIKHHECTPVGSRIKPGGSAGVVVVMPPASPMLKVFLAGVVVGLVIGFALARYVF